jgi:gas vesicle protein
MKQNETLDGGVLIWGFIIGLVTGTLVALLKIPKGGTHLRQQITETGEALREKLEAAVPADPLAESMAEGKAAARRRRVELGL